jgi:hypothetical protein
MNVVFLDCVSGASGDMLLGALADAGVPADLLRQVIKDLGLQGCELSFERVSKGGISALQAVVSVPEQQEHRHFMDLLRLVQDSALDEAIKSKTIAILERLAGVEAQIHNTPLESVHLHELGGDDTLIDIAGVLTGLRALGVGEVVCSPLPLARGWTRSAHGLLPLPAPATLALLNGVPIRPLAAEAELVTPTGAAILTGIGARFGDIPLMRLSRVGVGAGRRDLPFPNILRLWLGERTGESEASLIFEQLFQVETNIDDMNPQIYADVMDHILAAGALDVTLTPVQMKKNRPAISMTVLCTQEILNKVIEILLAETTTLGVRYHLVDRVALPRRSQIVKTQFGPIRVKVVVWKNHTRLMPEYEDCRKAATEHGVPLAIVIDAAREAFSFSNKAGQMG